MLTWSVFIGPVTYSYRGTMVACGHMLKHVCIAYFNNISLHHKYYLYAQVEKGGMMENIVIHDINQ